MISRDPAYLSPLPEQLSLQLCSLEQVHTLTLAGISPLLLKVVSLPAVVVAL